MAFTKINAAGIGTTETVTVDGLTVINNGSFGGNLTVAGVLTYEDVTNVDSVGLITARNGIVVGSGITLSKDGDIFATGVTTTGSLVSSGAISGTTGTFTGDVDIADKIVHTGDTNTAIRFPAADTITAETGGSERVRIASSGYVGVGINDPARILHLHEASSDTVQLHITNSTTGTSGSDGVSFALGSDESLIINQRESNHISLKTADTERLRILSGGEVAIGGNGYAGQPFSVQTSSTNLGYMQSTGTTRAVMAFVDANSSVNVGYGCIGNNHVFMKDGNEKARITSDGDVLIGSTSAVTNTKLIVQDSGTTLLRIANTDDGTAGLVLRNTGSSDCQISNTSATLKFEIGGSEKLRITSTGQVKITGADDQDNFIVDAAQTQFKIHQDSTDGEVSLRAEDGSGNNYTKYMTFFVESGSGSTERLRINEHGNVMITGKNASIDHTQTSQLVPLFLKTSTNLTAVDTAEGDSSDGLFRLEDGSSSNDRYHGIELRSKRGGDIRILNQDRMSNSGDLVIAQYSDDAGQGLKEKIRLSGVYDAVQIAGKGGASINANLADQVQKTDVYISTKSEMTDATMNAGAELAGIIRFHETGNNNNRFHGIEFRNKNSGDIRILNQASTATNFASMVFVTDNGSLVQRMIINGNGNIGAPSGNNIYNASDERLKENIVELTDGLNKINQIKPVSFTWKEGWDPNLDGLTQYGFGAHQVKSVDEILVESFGEKEITLNGETIDNPLRVNEKHVIPLLVKAVQELSAKVAALEG